MMGTSAGHAQSFFALLLPFMYLFINLIAFTMITILKKTREKIHLNKTQKRRSKVRDRQQSEAPN